MKAFEQLQAHLAKVADVAYSAAVLSWDQETNLPEKGAEFRARQLSTLAGIQHELSTGEEMERLIQDAKKDRDLKEWQIKCLEIIIEDFERQKKYTTQFVQDLSLQVSAAFQNWQLAKEKSDFSIFEKSLEKLVELKKQECEILGYTQHPYDALLNQYEKGMSVKKLEPVFENLKKELPIILHKIYAAPQVSDEFFKKFYEKNKQWEFSLEVLKDMGFDFSAGRQDLSSHPFTINFNPLDVRITTRVDENDLSEIIWSSIHEGGHALYEQGLYPETYGLPASEACSLGIHESQSRIWENNMGRSLSFWKYYLPKLQSLFPANLKPIGVEDFYKGMNKVEPSLIRTNADEITYHFHVIIRYEIEKELIAGNYKVSDLPKIWREKYKTYLNIEVPDDRLGVLQDVHWSHGSFGYFPTYSIGSLYAAQFFAKAHDEIPDLDQQISRGDFKEFLNWLRVKIHRHGRLKNSEEICNMVCGSGLDASYFLDYVKKKYKFIYGF